MGPEIYPAPLERIPRNAGQAWPILDHAARGTMECWSVGGKARPFGDSASRRRTRFIRTKSRVRELDGKGVPLCKIRVKTAPGLRYTRFPVQGILYKSKVLPDRFYKPHYSYCISKMGKVLRYIPYSRFPRNIH